MRKFVLALPLCLSLMLSLGSCGSGGGNSSAGGNGTGAANTVTAAGTVRLAWDAPASSGPAISNISGYNVHYGTSSGNYDKSISNGSQTTCTVSGLSPGTYYFAVTSYDAEGNESAFSNEVSKTVQ